MLMLINGKPYRSLKYSAPVRDSDEEHITIIDQREIPFNVTFEKLYTSEDVITAIKDMHLRGAPLIGIAAAFGVVFACSEAMKAGDSSIIVKQADKIIKARPTAVNTENVVKKILKEIDSLSSLKDKHGTALTTARQLIEEDSEACRMIGEYGLKLIKELSEKKKNKTVNILTHCNAGWLACTDYGTATSPIYRAKEEGIDLHVWVDETRPRNQGARLTVWELTENGIKNTLITDNAGGHLMQKGLVDIVLVGSDRTTINGDAANKIGTYLKALAAKDNNIPFWVAVPGTSIENSPESVTAEIKIEERSDSEILCVEGLSGDEIRSVLISCKNTACCNPGFDVTPSRLVTGLITERGLCKPDKEEILKLFPEINVNP